MPSVKEYYDKEYASGRYANIYKVTPEDEARVFSEYLLIVDLMISVFQLNPKQDSILEFGCGTGNMLKAWIHRGFENIVGLDVSDVAVEMAADPHIRQGSFEELESLAGENFTVCYTSQVLEHLTDQEVIRLIKAQMACSRYAAHTIADEIGGDPSHINIKTPQMWNRFFLMHTGCAEVIPNIFSVRTCLHVLYTNEDVPASLAMLHRLRSCGFIRPHHTAEAARQCLELGKNGMRPQPIERRV